MILDVNSGTDEFKKNASFYLRETFLGDDYRLCSIESFTNPGNFMRSDRETRAIKMTKPLPDDDVQEFKVDACWALADRYGADPAEDEGI